MYKWEKVQRGRKYNERGRYQSSVLAELFRDRVEEGRIADEIRNTCSKFEMLRPPWLHKSVLLYAYFLGQRFSSPVAPDWRGDETGMILLRLQWRRYTKISGIFVDKTEEYNG